jgi:hypothetical protein
MKKKLLVVSLLSLASASIMAQSNSKETGPYVELGLIQAYYKDDVVNFNNGMASFKAGYNFTKNFALEGMIAGNINSANFYYRSTNITAQVQNAYGIYGKGTIELNDTVSLYAKVGATNGTLSASSAFGSAWTSGTSPAYGAGIQANINKDVYVSLDYMSYYNRDGVSIAGPSINVGYKF